MPAKFDPSNPQIAELIASFESIGLSKAKATDAARSPKSSLVLKELIESKTLPETPLDEKTAVLVLTLASQCGALGPDERAFAVHAIIEGKLKTADQISAAIKFLTLHTMPVDQARFDLECGVGVNPTNEEIEALVEAHFKDQSPDGWAAIMGFISSAKATPGLRWASPLEVKLAVEKLFTDKFGPKEAAAKSKQKEPKGSKAPVASSSKREDPALHKVSDKTVFEEGFLGKLHKPGGNPQIHPHLREEHLKATGGKVFTRFPPEPNGYLHIGHSKAIFVNFGYAAHYGGHCYLRYDDTNPEAEEARYFESILEMIRWLGFEPYKITYSSDNFQRLYELAVELIKRDKAYICHCTGEQIHAARGGENRGPRTACEHRNRPIEESLVEFEGMKTEKYKPGEAILRMKQDLEDGNPQMWDLVAYRVLDTPHHRTGSTWRIYPTYDFTHCLCDSFENISHSLCTTEFITARQSYDWLCDALEVYKPRQSEYGRLSLTGTITSKRKILKLVKGGHVLDWDDPRLYSLIALRRRGIPPEAIISFVSTLGVSTAGSVIQTTRFEQVVRQHLENTVPRLLMVLKPLKVTLENVGDDFVHFIEKPLHPKIPELGKGTIPFTRTLYIDEDDFRTHDSEDYFRLAPGKTVGLFQGPHPITYVSHTSDDSGKVTELICRLEDGQDGKSVPKPKAFIQWVAEHAETGSPVRIQETRIFHPLFKSDNPAAEDDFLADINPDSLEILENAMLEVGFWPLARKMLADAHAEAQQRQANAPDAIKAEGDTHPAHAPTASAQSLVGNECVRFQGLRVGYFCLDKQAKVEITKGDDADALKNRKREGDVVILNRIVSLKEDAGKSREVE